MDNPRRNSEGYSDPTAYEAIRNCEEDPDSRRFYLLLNTIFNLCELAGFKLEGRVKLRDKKTGKVWK